MSVPGETIKRDARPGQRSGLTLLELLIVCAIIVVLMGVGLISGKMVRGYRARAIANQQMAVISAAIEEYAAFWPRWEATVGTSRVVIADKGWPDFIPGRLFAPGTFAVLSAFNDNVVFDVTDIEFSAARDSWDDPDAPQSSGDVLNANSCLAYSLTATQGKGPLITDKEGADLRELAKVHKQKDPPLYPPYAGSPSSQRREVFVDPWGSPYRYFWVYRDPEPSLANRAYRGFLPVSTADLASPDFRKADGFVFESAGPDKQFGNVWKANPTGGETEQADDNLIVMP